MSESRPEARFGHRNLQFTGLSLKPVIELLGSGLLGWGWGCRTRVWSGTCTSQANMSEATRKPSKAIQDQPGPKPASCWPLGLPSTSLRL